MQATRVRILIFGTLALGWIIATPSGASAGFLVGGNLTVSVDDSPIGTNFTQTVTLSPGMTTLDQGEMTLTQSLVSTGPNTQWLVLDFEATGGRLLAGNLSGFWDMGADTPLSAPGGFTGFFGYWSVNGTPTSPIHPFLGITQIYTDPIDPSKGLVYGSIFSQPIVSGTTSLSLPDLTYVTPYQDISLGGMDPNAVNGWVEGIQVTNTSSVPGPSSLCLAAIGAVAAGGAALARRRRRLRRAWARDLTGASRPAFGVAHILGPDEYGTLAVFEPKVGRFGARTQINPIPAMTKPTITSTHPKLQFASAPSIDAFLVTS